ncbi:hypothetical protein ABF87_03685 [Nitrosomonas sp. JL21]|uniref:hypothetical protein n=1 Tax=Nitrosomonas sp. JL21 TaxID=153949 RepID=UPI00136E9088|nr:hypothetical protein [Nitrosomonas sp. JL21]MBL8497203.1 hypothetical protein [Nitrosomonas sp.]MXS77072.1 hypothetical protein [Nitrosomonas sp. JL21]
MQVQTLRIIVAAFLTFAIMLFFYTGRERDHYSRSAEPAITQILKEISSWDRSVVLLHLAPETKQVINDEQLENILTQYRQFGRFKTIQELNFSRMASAFSLLGEKHINYSGTADFDAGLISLNITLVERGGFFLVYNFALSKSKTV